MHTIFVGGIHAVGKSTVCKALSEKLGIPHYTASHVIRAEKAAAVSETSKLVTNVAENQQLLIRGVSRILQGGHFLLDGHFTMRRQSDGDIESIHSDVFRDLRVGGVILYVDAPGKIAERMHARDGVLHPVDLLQAHQDAEIAHARFVAKQLAVPLAVLEAFDVPGATDALKAWLAG